MKKLLNRTLKPFVLYSFAVFILSIPAYFLIINTVWQNELDKYHTVNRNKIERELNAENFSEEDLIKTLALWNRIEPGTKITPADKIKPDRFFNIMRFDKHYGEREQFRSLSTYITIRGKLYHLLIETNMEEVDETILIIAGVTLLFFLLLIAGFVLLNRKLSLKLWKPFYSSMDELKSFDLNSQDKISLPASDIVEFEELNTAIHRLVNKNAAVFRQQKEFSENASHELQTPLAMLQSKIDLLLQDQSLTEKQAAIIGSLNAYLTRISRINKNLLLLSKLESGQFQERETYNISSGISENLILFEEHLTSKNIAEEHHIEPAVTVLANKTLFEVLFTNLFINAIKHNHTNGKIYTEVSIKGFSISNTGKMPLQDDKLFQRFITSSSNTPSSGLGLAIAKEICRLHGWEITYSFHGGNHSFLVKF